MFEKQLREIKKYFKELPPNLIDQAKGQFQKSEPCCFGAHLAHVLLDGSHYLRGALAFKDRLGIKNDAELLLLFMKAGLNRTIYPFSITSWNLPVLEVIENLEKIKKIPDTKGADLRGANLRGANLTSVDLRGADLRGADLLQTDLEDAKSTICEFI